MSVKARYKQKTRKLKNTLGIAGVALAALLMGSSAQAAISMGINQNFDGTPPNSSTTPWVSLLFQDIGLNTVRLTITAPNLTLPSEFIETLRLNFNDTKNVTSLVFTPVLSLWQGLSTSVTVTEKQNGFKAADGSGGSYDISLGFATSPGQGQFTKGDQAVFDITTTQGSTGLSSQDFAFLSSGTPGNVFYAAAAIFGTGPKNNKNGWDGANSFTVLGVPEPASGYAAVSCCFAGLISARRVKKSLRGLLA
jgi:hypothetical protein